MFKAKIDNKTEITIEDGYVIKDQLDETLDSGTINFISHSPIDIAPFDTIEISGALENGNEIETKRLLIDTPVIDTENPNQEDEINICTSSLFSETKNLERITLPSLRITQSKDATQRHSVAWYIARYVQQYSPKIRIGSTSNPAHENYSLVNKYVVDSIITQRFDGIECPEFQWNNPTLREVLNDLMMVDDCIVILKHNMVSFYDLKDFENQRQIDKTKLSKIRKSQTSADAISELTVPMANSIGQQTINRLEFIGLRTQDESELENTNAQIITQYPIYKLKRVDACFEIRYRQSSDDDYTTTYAELNITNFINEYDEWRTLKAYGDNRHALPYSTNGRNAHAYYKMGENKIEGIIDSVKAHSTAVTKTTRLNLMVGEFFKNFDSYSIRTDVLDVSFKVQYETSAERKMNVGKYLPAKHQDNQVYDQQTSSYVDTKQMSIFEYAKANRLGNEMVEIYAEYDNEGDVPQLADKLDDNILFAREIAYFDNVISFHGTLTKNYILKNYFTSIQAKRRSWQYVKGNEASIRYDIDKSYAEWSFYRKYEKYGYNLDYLNLVTPLKNYTASPIKYACVRTKDASNNQYPANPYYYALETSVETMGNSICIDYGFTDNVNAGIHIELDNKIRLNQIYKYVDANGEIKEINATLTNEIDATDGTGEWSTISDDARVNLTRVKPRIKTIVQNPVNFSTTRTIYKDNAEVLRECTQIEYCSDTADILCTDKFVERCQLASETNNDINDLKVYVSTDETYDLSDTKAKGTEHAGDIMQYLVAVRPLTSYTTVIVSFANIITRLNYTARQVESYAITDTEGNILLAVNSRKQTDRQIIYLNTLKTRDCNQYDGAYSQNVIFSISTEVEQPTPTAPEQAPINPEIIIPTRPIHTVDIAESTLPTINNFIIE